MNALKRRDRIGRNKPHQLMSSKTKDFLQKICYKKTASVDMTQYGFISDSKVNPVNLLMKPLREKLETICGSGTSRKSSLKKQTVVKRNEKGLARSRLKVTTLANKLKIHKHVTKSKSEPKKVQAKIPLKKKKSIF